MKSVITTIALLFVFQITFGQTGELAKLDSFFSKLEEHDRFFGSVAVYRSGEVIYTKAIGYADLKNKIPNTSETKFRIGSITKTFTATLIMKAVEMGKINLDDTIDTYFPRIENAKKITVRHLLNHRSGINTFTDRDYLSWYTKPITRANLLNKIVSKGIDFEPNAKYAYSNSNYVLLTFIIENIFGKPYAWVLEKYITKPLDLAHTSYGGKINSAQNEARSYRMKTEWILKPEEHMSIPLGAGGIISTPTDLCYFAEALFDGKLITPESLKQMKPHGNNSYGFALEYQTFDGIKGLGHNGAIDAFTSTMVYFEENDLSIALTCNGSNYGMHDVASAVLNAVLGKPFELPAFESIELNSEELDQYLGTYESDQMPMDFAISKEGNILMLKATGQPSSPLTAEGNHIFSIMKFGVKITFMPSLKKLYFEQQGLKFEMTLKEASEPNELSNENLDQYIGTYKSDQLPIDIVISKKAHTLIAKGTGQPSFPLKSEGNHIFSNKAIGLKITFILDGKKMLFEQGGAKFEMDINEED